MVTYIVRVFLSTIFLAFLSSACMTGIVSAAQEETIMGMVVKSGKRFVIEADDGDYIVTGKDLSKLVGELVLVTGIITESDKGDRIEVRSVEDIQDTLPE